MRIIVDLASHIDSNPQIIQVEKVPEPGYASATPISGKYVLPIVPGVEFPVDMSSYVIPINGGDVSSISYAHFLAMFPMFGNVYFNPLLTNEHVADLDLAATFTDPVSHLIYPTRCQTGRPLPLLNSGQMPTHTALLAQNDGAIPPRPGIIVTDEIDIGPYTMDGGIPIGADQFMVYWRLLGFDVQEDMASDKGANAGVNSPATRRVFEVDQEPDGWSAYISPDNGSHWCPAGLLEPVAFASKTTKFRLAFKNTSSDKVFLATYAVLF